MKVLVINFGTPSTKFFFALIKKIFLQTLIEIIFRYHLFSYYSFGTPWAPLRTKLNFLHVRSFIFLLQFWDPLGPPYEHNEFFTYEVLGIKIG